MEEESVWDDGMHIDGRWHSFQTVIGEEVLYSDTKFFREFDDPPHGDLRVEEISLRWKDGSITKIQMERPPAVLEPRELDPLNVDGKADWFYQAVQGMLWDLFNGSRYAGVEARIDLEGNMCFDSLVADEQEQGRMQSPE